MTEHATATVTFLFTDIEGSTKRWEKFPDAMAVAVARHDVLLRSVIEAHGGHVFKTIGDAFCAAFVEAPHALEAVLEAQRAIAAEEWGDVSPLRVRMALHTGSVQLRDNDYFGPTVNRVARLLSIGHGGQSLVSGATYQLLHDSMPADTGWWDMGEHRLKDLARAEHVYQLTAPDLPTEFPALNSLNRQVHNLPVHPTPLVGRDEEVNSALALLRDPDVRLVSLLGPGGTGKTRLSLQVAAESMDGFVDGVFYIPLLATTDAEQVATSIAVTLGVKETAGQPLVHSIKDHLREKKSLLVLDNFEQVTSAAPIVAELLTAGPGSKVLVTSRIALNLRGEREFRVPPLAMPQASDLVTLNAIAKYAAIELFVQRAQAVKPSFALTDENASAVCEICRRLDGLPLAIELAAARIKLLAPQAMLAHLKNRLKFLTGGARDLPEHQQTLRNAIAWSHDMLDEGEKALFRRLAVFSGGFSMEAAMAVCERPGGAEIDVFDGLGSLTDKSLLRQEDLNDESRFFMLETIREFGLERLGESGEVSALQESHAQFYGEMVQSFAVEESGEFELVRCATEYDNVRSALDWLIGNGNAAQAAAMAIALCDYWDPKGSFSEGREYLARCVERQGEIGDKVQVATLLRLLGWFLHLLAANAEALQLQQRSLEVCRELADAEGEAATLNNLGVIVQAQGDAQGARGFFERSLTIVRELGDAAGTAMRLSNLGKLEAEEGHYAEARRYLEEASTMYQALGDRHGSAACLCNLSDLALKNQEWELAWALAEQSLELFRALEDRRGIVFSLANSLEAAVRGHASADAEPTFREAARIAWETGMQWLIPPLLELRCRALAERGDDERALFSLAVASLYRDRLGMDRSAEEGAELDELERDLSTELGAISAEVRTRAARLQGAALVAALLAGDTEMD